MSRTDDDIQTEFDQIVEEAVSRLDQGFFDDANFAVTCVCDDLQDEGLISYDEEYNAVRRALVARGYKDAGDPS
jgi:hypothetical protein